MARRSYVYILTNQTHRVLYTGVTSDLRQRVIQHREGEADSFTARYKVNILVYYEEFDDVQDAIAREKQIKGGSRAKKLALVESMNAGWIDLAEGLP